MGVNGEALQLHDVIARLENKESEQGHNGEGLKGFLETTFR